MTGRGVTFEVAEHIGAEAGPTVSLLGGVHGDEEEGVLAAQRVAALLGAAPPMRGTVRTVSVAHPAAYAANRRTSPLDGHDLARCFPGDAAGSATERLAHALTERMIRGSDLLIDLHSAGRDYAMPTFVGFVDTGDDVAERARRAAIAFGAPLVWEHAGRIPPGRTVTAAIALGVPAIYAETAGGGSVERGELTAYVDGVLAVLAELGVIADPGRTRRIPRRVVRGAGGDLDAGVRAEVDGRFVAWRRAGDALAAGDPIGEIVDEVGATAQAIAAPGDATLMFLRRRARIAAGDVVCSLAPPATKWGD